MVLILHSNALKRHEGMFLHVLFLLLRPLVFAPAPGAVLEKAASASVLSFLQPRTDAFLNLRNGRLGLIGSGPVSQGLVSQMPHHDPVSF